MVETKQALRPSSLFRGLLCHASPLLEYGVEDKTSDVAQWGIDAHELVSLIHEKKEIPADADPEKVALAQETYSIYKSYMEPGDLLFIEVALDVSDILNEPAKGTADCVIYSPSRKSVYVLDLKTGKGKTVYAQDNPQLLAYTHGALKALRDWVTDVETISMIIVQTRKSGHMDQWTLSVNEFVQEVETVKLATAEIQRVFKSGDPEGHYTPGFEQCQWCKGRVKCPALRLDATKLFEDFRAVPDLEDAQLDELFEKAQMAGAWADAIKEEIKGRMEAGNEFSLVKFKPGAKRKLWVDNAMPNLISLLGDQVLVPTSPSEVLKMVKGDSELEAKVAKLITEEQNSPSLVATKPIKKIKDLFGSQREKEKQ